MLLLPLATCVRHSSAVAAAPVSAWPQRWRHAAIPFETCSGQHSCDAGISKLLGAYKLHVSTFVVAVCSALRFSLSPSRQKCNSPQLLPPGGCVLMTRAKALAVCLFKVTTMTLHRVISGTPSPRLQQGQVCLPLVPSLTYFIKQEVWCGRAAALNCCRLQPAAAVLKLLQEF